MNDKDIDTDAIIKLLLDDARLVIGYAVRIGVISGEKTSQNQRIETGQN